MKKLYVLLLMLFVVGCDVKTDDSNYYNKSKIDDVNKVAEISNGFFLYEKNLDTDNGFNRYYYVGTTNDYVYQDLVTYFGFGNKELFQAEDFIYKFVGIDKIESDNCMQVGIKVDILDNKEEILYSYSEIDNLSIEYCIKDGKPYFEK